MVFVAYILQMLAWFSLMKSLGYYISISGVIQGYIISFLPRYIPGTIWGYLSRSEWLYVNYHIPYASSSVGSMLEIGLGLLTCGMVILVYSTWSFLPIPFKFIELIFVLFFLPWLVWCVLKKTELLSNFKFGEYFKDVKFELKPWWIAYILYLLIWGVYGLSLIFIINQYDNIQYLPIGGLIFAYSLSWLIGFIVLIAPAGLGVRELTLSSLLVFQFQFPSDIADATAVISRLVLYFVEVVWLLLSYVFSKAYKC
jgi:hypothetical protein